MQQDLENKGINLLHKGKSGILRAVFSRTGIITGLLLVQIFILFAVFFWLEEFQLHYFGGTAVFTACMVIYLINEDMDPTAKITWLAVIMALPVFGSLLYLFTTREVGHRALRRRLSQLKAQTAHAIGQDIETLRAFETAAPGAAAMARYVGSSGCFPVFRDTQVTYFPGGEEKFQAMLSQLEKAEKYIFLEYFIVDEGLMWGKVLEILACKAAQGVDVRVMYDGTCEFLLLPKDYPRMLGKLGIRCKVFAPVLPFVSTHYNYRDHRKILVVDGHTAFCGGVNLADEYINHITKFGHWKDTAVMLQGGAAQSFSLMFLEMWGMDEKHPDWQSFLAPPPAAPGQGYVMPFGESPLDGERVGRQVYMDILNRARRYVHIMTPYLILDAEMENALKYAAKRGVEVCLILPGIPDKRIPYALAKTHYKSLLEAGVKLYEYTPGFVHAKVFVSDDTEAVVGTINLDYRSLYHHFECAAYLHAAPCVADIEKDFADTRKSCREVTFDTVKKEKLTTKLLGWLLKIFAPLM